MGVPALGAARAPFVDYDTVYFEHDREAYLRRLESFLTADRLEVPGGGGEATPAVSCITVTIAFPCHLANLLSPLLPPGMCA